MKVKKDKISQLIATMLLLIFIPSIVPAQEFSSQIKTGKMHMEYYLDRASMGRNCRTRNVSCNDCMGKFKFAKIR